VLLGNVKIMGQYTYLVNKKEMIYVEAYKITGGGESNPTIEEVEKLTKFLHYSFLNNLEILCVDENWIDNNQDLEANKIFNELK
jgi:hypothetical protein